ncbi:unnamed protein product [Rhodiola kirilowii]
MAVEPMEIVPESESFDLETIRSRLGDIAEICRTCKNDDSEMDSSDSDRIIYECASQIRRRVDQVVSECSEIDALGDEDLEACLAHLETNLRIVEEEKTQLSNETGVLTRTFSEDITCLEIELERLNYLLDHIPSKDLECSAVGHGNPSEDNSLAVPLCDTKFEMMELSDQLEKKNIILQSLQDLDTLYRRLEAVENIEDTLTGVRVLGYEKNCIRFAVRTYIPSLDGSFSEPKVGDIPDPFVLDHELSIKVVDGTLEPENLLVIPSDIHFDVILVAAKSVRHTRTLEWLIRKVQDRIIICALRRNVLKAANSSRYSFEYNDSEEIIICHMVGEVNAYIEVPPSWPLMNSPLKLISLKSPDQKNISLALLCKVQETANSLDTFVLQNLQSFAEAIEKILVQQMQAELHHSDILNK